MKCDTCHRDPQRMHSEVAECSHCECPHRKPVTAQPRQPWQVALLTERFPTPCDLDQED